ncbi:MAG: hypothetical protein IJN43_13845 [Ruminococcus sp.]|nr:hypothetical protein [Ruminococcus sp.]
MSIETGMALTILCLVLIVALAALYFYLSYVEQREHNKDMRRLARTRNRDIRDTERAFEDICLESMRRDGYMFRRGSK